jgi:hypothetical protein
MGLGQEHTYEMRFGRAHASRLTKEANKWYINAMRGRAKPKPANGFHSVSEDELRRILDLNARKLVNMSGDEALRAIRTRKRRDNSAGWTAFRMLASMLD